MNSELFLFELNELQLQMLYQSLRKQKPITSKDVQSLCESLGILPELIGPSTLKSVLSYNSSSLAFPAFFQLLKQIVSASFSKEVPLKEKCRRFFSHIAPVCLEKYAIDFKLRGEIRKTQSNIQENSFEIKEKDTLSKQNSLKVTIQLKDKGNKLKSKPNNNASAKTGKKFYNRAFSAHETPVFRQTHKKLKKTKTLIKNETKPDYQKIKNALRELQDRYHDTNKSVNAMVSSHRNFIVNKVGSMFHSTFVLGLIFSAWKNECRKKAYQL